MVSIRLWMCAGSLLKTLDLIKHQALRLCSGGFRSTPTSALQVEMGKRKKKKKERPLEIRIQKPAIAEKRKAGETAYLHNTS